MMIPRVACLAINTGVAPRKFSKRCSTTLRLSILGLGLGLSCVQPATAAAFETDDASGNAAAARAASHSPVLLLSSANDVSVGSPSSASSPSAAAADPAIGSNQQAQREAQQVQDAQVAAQQPGIFSNRLTLETGLTYTRVDRRELALSGFYALDAIFLGRLTLDQVKGNAWTFDVTTRYGLSDHLSVDLNLPFVYRDNLYISQGLGGAGNKTAEASIDTSDIGDASIGLSYQLPKKAASEVDMIASIRLRAPTGRNPFGIRLINPTDPNDPNTANTNLNIPEQLPTGNGLWALIGNVSFIKTLDPLVLFGNVGYIYNQKRSFDDISAGLNVPGSVKLGDALQLGAGFAFAVNDTTSFSLSSNILASRTSKTQQEGQAWQDVAGSSGNAATLNVGLTHAFSKRLSISSNVAVGMTNDAPNYSVGVRVPYTF